MTKVHSIAFGFIDRLSRALIGVIVGILSFAYAINSEMFATMQFVAMYPIFTALVAWDPFYVIAEGAKQQWINHQFINH